MSNFNFLLADFPELYADAVEAEQLTLLSPKAAAIFCRSTLENAINWLYDHDPKLNRPSLIEPSFLGFNTFVPSAPIAKGTSIYLNALVWSPNTT
ncbi:MAG TPA: hypothetical protein VES38_12700 [Methylotenera sp.]|nr:hypothetical protein [Methylotenera sp.]